MTQQAVGDRQTEKQFSDAIVEYARLCGWLVHRDPTWRATGADPGYPDLTLARTFISKNGTGRSERRIIFAELKVGKNKLTSAQLDWYTTLVYGRSKTVEVYIWRPEDWPEIEKVLR